MTKGRGNSASYIFLSSGAGCFDKGDLNTLS